MHYSVSDLRIMAENIEASKMFRAGKEKRPLSIAQVMTLLLISNAEGRHPALGLKDYDIIDGKPAKKTECMMRDFLQAGGSVVWHKLDDTGAAATFSHPQGGTVRIDWDVEKAKKVALLSKDMWQKWRRNMFRSRVVSEGVRTVYPAATSGTYNTEEMQDMSDSLALPPTVVENPAEPLDNLCERLAADVAISTDLTATYIAHAETFARIELERPEYMALIQPLFEARQEELAQQNTAQSGIVTTNQPTN